MIFNLIEKYWPALTALVAMLIGIGSLTPLEHLPPAPGSDKTHHFIAYALLALPTAIARPKYWLWLIVLFIAYGGLIELVQPYVNRYREWLDMLANTTGVLIALALAGLIRLIKNSKQ